MPPSEDEATSIIGLLWMGAALASSQSVTAWTVDEGLPQSNVRGLATDDDGLWVGTQAGLAHFDGRSFAGFGLADGLPSDDVRAIAVGPDGTLWVGTTAGLARRAAGATRFDAVGPRCRVVQVRIDPDGTVWVGSDRGVQRVVGDTLGPLVRTGPVIDFARVGGTLAMLQPDRQAVRVDLDTGATEVQPLPGVPFVLGDDVDGDGVVWVGLLDGTVLRWSADGLVPVAQVPEHRALQTSPDGSVRVWGRHEAVRLDPLGREVGRRPPPANHAIEAVTTDARGQIWFGTSQGLGVIRNPAMVSFDTRDGLPSNVVRPMARDARGALWIGTDAGLCVMEGLRCVPRLDGTGGVHAMATVGDQLWLGTAGGLLISDGASWTPHPTLILPIAQIQPAPSGDVFVAVHNGGVLRLSAEAPMRPAEPVEVPDNEGVDARLLATRDGRLVVGGERGLSVLQDGRWSRYTTADGLAHDDVYFLAEAPDGSVWFGYNASVGLTRLDGTTVTTWTTEQGLAHDAVYSIGFDDHGRAWVGTASGVDRVDKREVLHFSVRDGYAHPESNSGGFWADPDGTLWFGTAGGLTRLEPELLPDLLSPPRPRVELRTLDGVPVAGDLMPDDGVQAIVTWGDLVDPARVEAEVRVPGWREAWTPVGGDGTVQLGALPAGTHALEVRARMGGGPWSGTTRRSWSVAPRWHDRPAVGVAALVLGVLLLLAVARASRYRAEQRSARLREQMQVRFEAEQAARRANEAKSLFLARMSHELRTPLNAILGYGELLEEDVDDAQRPDVARILEAGRRLLNLVDQALDLTKIEAGELPIRPEPLDLAPLLRAQAARARPRCGVRQAVHVPDSLPMVGDPLRIEQVVEVLLDNACKFTEAGTVGIDVEADASTVRIAVSDTGPGVSERDQERIFEAFAQGDDSPTRRHDGTGLGLAVAHRLAVWMGGTLSLHSEPGRGSRFVLELPRAHEAQPSA